MWRLTRSFDGEYWWCSEHKSLAAAKAKASVAHGVMYRDEKGRDAYVIYAPDGKLCLTSGPGNGWRLRWKKV